MSTNTGDRELQEKIDKLAGGPEAMRCTAEEIAEDIELTGRTSPGPWTYEADDGDGMVLCADGIVFDVRHGHRHGDANGLFAEHARVRYPRALDELKALRSRLEMDDQRERKAIIREMEGLRDTFRTAVDGFARCGLHAMAECARIRMETVKGVIASLGRRGGHDRPRPRVVCLCGSTRFWQEFQRIGLEETKAGRIVLSIGAATASDTEHLAAGVITPAEKAMFDELHLRKIDISDEVLVIDPGGYVGESTRREIAYAYQLGLPVRWLVPPVDEALADHAERRAGRFGDPDGRGSPCCRDGPDIPETTPDMKAILDAEEWLARLGPDQGRRVLVMGGPMALGAQIRTGIEVVRALVAALRPVRRHT